jgi:hypothetical protein
MVLGCSLQSDFFVVSVRSAVCVLVLNFRLLIIHEILFNLIIETLYTKRGQYLAIYKMDL